MNTEGTIYIFKVFRDGPRLSSNTKYHLELYKTDGEIFPRESPIENKLDFIGTVTTKSSKEFGNIVSRYIGPQAPLIKELKDAGFDVEKSAAEKLAR